ASRTPPPVLVLRLARRRAEAHRRRAPPLSRQPHPCGGAARHVAQHAAREAARDAGGRSWPAWLWPPAPSRWYLPRRRSHRSERFRAEARNRPTAGSPGGSVTGREATTYGLRVAGPAHAMAKGGPRRGDAGPPAWGAGEPAPRRNRGTARMGPTQGG